MKQFNDIFLFFAFALLFSFQSLNAQRSLYLSENVNIFIGEPDIELNDNIEYAYPDGLLSLIDEHNFTIDSLLNLISAPSLSDFTLKKEVNSFFDENWIYETYHQYYNGIRVMNGGFIVKKIANQNNLISRFYPNIFYGISISTSPTIDSTNLVSILVANEIFSLELYISDDYNSNYSLIWEINFLNVNDSSRIAWVDAHSGSIYEITDDFLSLNGTTYTYGVQSLNDYTDDDINYVLKTPDSKIRIYEDLNQAGIFNFSAWVPSLIPATVEATWDVDANIISRSTFYAADVVVPVFEDVFDIDFGNIHIATYHSVGAWAFRLSRFGEDVYMQIGIKDGVPFALFDVIGHELGHIYLYPFLSIPAGNSLERVLHEGLADVIGTYIEDFILPNGTDWIMGGEEEVVEDYAENRDLSKKHLWNPSCLGQHNSPHTCGLPIGHWFYTLSNGSPSINVLEFGMDEVILLIRETIEPFTERRVTPQEFVAFTILRAEAIYGVCSPEYQSVINAFEHVNFTEATVGTTFMRCVCEEYDKPILDEILVFNDCPDFFVNLNDYYTGTPPENCILVWSTDPNGWPEPDPIVDPLITLHQNPTYYAYYYNTEEGCYSVPSDGIEVTIKFCCDNTDNVYISGNEIYDTPIFVGGDIFVEDQGTLTITNYLEMGEDKRIIVEKGGKLIIQGSSAVLTVCNSSTGLWNGIRVLAGGELNIHGGKILNAKNGIYAQSDLITYTIPPPVINIQGIEIVGNSISEITRGITMVGVSPVNLSEAIIENYTYGVYLWGGSGGVQRVENSEFSNISYSGIYSIYNDFRITNCNFKNSNIGVGGFENNMGTIEECNFLDLNTGINIMNSKILYISKNEMDLSNVSGSTGIQLHNSNHTSISNQTIAARRYGILLFNSPTSLIFNNSISISNSAGGQIGGAISLVNSSGSFINDNNIYSELGSFGIECNNSHNTVITGNNILSNTTRSGIHLVGSMGVEVISNSVLAPQSGSQGIRLSNSAGNEIVCNIIENQSIGIEINHNSESQLIHGNVLHNNTDLTIRSEIGLQPFHGNLFKGGVARAFGLNADQIRDSRFFVNSDYDYHIPVNVNSGSTQQWFFDDTDELDYFECPDGTNIPEEWTPFSQDSFDLCQYYQHLKTLDTIKPNKFFLGVFDLLFLSEIRQDFSLPGCILSDPDFQNLCGLQELVDVIIDLEQYGQHELATDSLISYQHQWLETTDSIQRTQLDSLIAGELASLSSGFETARTQDSVLLASIGSDLIAINCGSVLVTTWKGIYQQYLTFLQNGEVDSSDHNTLKQYSSLCSDIYGKPIHLARAITATFDTTFYTQNDDCLQGMEQRIIREQAIEETIEIWPNPSFGYVQIELPEGYSGTLSVLDISGRKIYTRSIKNANLSYLEMPYQNGLYIFRFDSDRGISSEHRVVLLR